MNGGAKDKHLPPCADHAESNFLDKEHASLTAFSCSFPQFTLLLRHKQVCKAEICACSLLLLCLPVGGLMPHSDVLRSQIHSFILKHNYTKP